MNMISLKGHKMTKHSDTQTFDKRHRKRIYQNCREEDGSFICTLCEERFLSKLILQKHTNEDHRQFICTECKEKFPWVCDNCSKHDKRVCKVCSGIFPDGNRLDMHMNVHLGIKPFLCEQCPFTARSKPNLNSHYKVHSEKLQQIRNTYTNTLPANKPCAECGKLFKKFYKKCYKHCYKRSDIDLRCKKECGYTTKSRDNLRSHHKNPTSRCNPEKPLLRIFFCKLCESSFTTNKYRNRHEKMHIEGKSHTCKVCNKKFSNSWTLKPHLKRIHSMDLDVHLNIVVEYNKS